MGGLAFLEGRTGRLGLLPSEMSTAKYTRTSMHITIYNAFHDSNGK